MGGDPQAVAGTTDGSFEHVTGTKLLTDNRSGDLFVAEGEHFRAREDLQLSDLREFGDDIFGHAVAEVFVFFGATLVFEIENRDRFSYRHRRRHGHNGAGDSP